jgi:ribosome recycling factor
MRLKKIQISVLRKQIMNEPKSNTRKVEGTEDSANDSTHFLKSLKEEFQKKLEGTVSYHFYQFDIKVWP